MIIVVFTPKDEGVNTISLKEALQEIAEDWVNDGDIVDVIIVNP